MSRVEGYHPQRNHWLLVEQGAKGGRAVEGDETGVMVGSVRRQQIYPVPRNRLSQGFHQQKYLAALRYHGALVAEVLEQEVVVMVGVFV
jgi:hypothetical protein